MKSVAGWITIAALTFAPLASYGEAAPNLETPAAQAHAKRAVGRMLSTPTVRLLTSENVTDLRERIEEAAKSKPREAAVGVGQTLLVMMTLAGVELTLQQVHKNGGHTPSPAQLGAIALSVANATVNSPQIWTSILMSSGFGLANKPAMALVSMLKIPRLQSAFVPLLARSITSTISFVGWDFGAQLWTEASLLLKSPEDYKIATGTFGMSKGVLSTALSTKAHSSSILDRNRARVAREMLTNMLLVLSVSNLRHELVYNFIRNDLLTGEFQTTLASFIACGAIGTAIFPGAGTLAGLIFGGVGIVVAQFIPQAGKDKVTNGWQYLRGRTLEFTLKQNLNDLGRDTTAASLRANDFEVLFLKHLVSRHDLRSRWVTIQWEQMHLEARAHRTDLAKTFAAHFAVMKQFYSADLSAIRALERASPDAMTRDDVKKLLRREEVRCFEMVQFFEALGAAAAVDPKNDEILKSIEAAQSRGFDETNAFLAWAQSA